MKGTDSSYEDFLRECSLVYINYLKFSKQAEYASDLVPVVIWGLTGKVICIKPEIYKFALRPSLTKKMK